MGTDQLSFKCDHKLAVGLITYSLMPSETYAEVRIIEVVSVQVQQILHPAAQGNILNSPVFSENHPASENNVARTLTATASQRIMSPLGALNAVHRNFPLLAACCLT